MNPYRGWIHGPCKVFVEAAVIGLPAGLLMAWAVAQEREGSKARGPR